LLFHGNSGYANAAQCAVTRKLPALYFVGTQYNDRINQKLFNPMNPAARLPQK